MDNAAEVNKDSERRKLQEDIERLQNVIGDDEYNSDEDSDTDVLHIDVAGEGEDGHPIRYSSHAGSTVPEMTDEAAGEDEIVINLNENVPIDPDTCLALNKAYQEVLLDTLRSIEMALIENREKQEELQDCLDDPKKDKTGQQKSRRTISSYQRPFFSDLNGDTPPPNADVYLKKRTEEMRQDLKPQLPWRSKMKAELKEAVYLDSLSQQTRHLLNRKEIYIEKLILMSKEANGEEYTKLEDKLAEIEEEVQRITNLPQDAVLAMVDIDKVDWMKISNTVLKNLRDPNECELYWRNTLNPALNKNEFNKTEKEKLRNLAVKHGERNWPTIAKELGTNRSPFQCFQFYQQTLNDVLNKREWTEEEDMTLIDVVENCKVGKTVAWNNVSYYVEGRSSLQCSQRWNQINPEMKRGKWSQEEDLKLLSSVYLHGEKNWDRIAEDIPGRTILQCRERYRSSLDPSLISPQVWSYEEDKQMLELAEQCRKPDGRIAWARLAEKMPGRTDNNVLIRYRKLMEWKEKTEWLEKQDPKSKDALGYINLEALLEEQNKGETKQKKNQVPLDYKAIQKKNEEDYRKLSKALGALPMCEFRWDYVKQLKDMREGNRVVPRPPLLYRSTRKYSKNIWARKKHMKYLIEKHLEAQQVTNPEDRASLPQRTAEEFKPFHGMDDKQMERMKILLQSNNPSQVSVRDMLDIVEKPKRNYESSKQAQTKKLNAILEVERRVLDVLQYKHCFTTKSRKQSGRRRKFYIFNPGGRKPMYHEEENTEQLSTVTSTLLINALEIDAKKVMTTYCNTKPKKQGDCKHLFSLLCRCYPKIAETLPKMLPPPPPRPDPGEQRKRGRPSKKLKEIVENIVESTNDQVNRVKSPETSQDSGSKVGRKGKAVTQGTTKQRQTRKRKSLDKGDVSPPKTLKTSPTGQQGSTVSALMSSGKKASTVSSSTSLQQSTALSVPTTSKQKTMSSPPSSGKKASTVPSSTSLQQSTTLPVPTTSKQKTVSSPSPTIISLNSQKSASNGPVPTALVVNSNTMKEKQIIRVVNPKSTGAPVTLPSGSGPANNQKVIVIKQAPKVPILPPCVCTLGGYEELLLQMNLLKSRAAEKYNSFYYYEKGQVLQKRMDPIVKEKTISSRLEINDKIDRYIEHSAKMVNNMLMRQNKAPISGQYATALVHPRKDLLQEYRGSEEFVKLKRRFDALFMWPALLSLLTPEAENFFDKQEQDADLVTYDEYSRIMEEEEKNRKSVKVGNRGNKARKGKSSAKFKVNHFKRKADISEKRRMAKMMQMKSIAEKGMDRIRAEKRAKAEALKNKKYKKWSQIYGVRASGRMIEKKEAEDEEDKLAGVCKSNLKVKSLRALDRVIEHKKKGSNINQALAKATVPAKRKRKIEKSDESEDQMEDKKSFLSPFKKAKEKRFPQKVTAPGIPPGYVLVPIVLPDGTTTAPGATGAATSGLPPLPPSLLQNMILMPQSTSGSVATSSGQPSFPILMMPNLTGTQECITTPALGAPQAVTSTDSLPTITLPEGVVPINVNNSSKPSSTFSSSSSGIVSPQSANTSRLSHTMENDCQETSFNDEDSSQDLSSAPESPEKGNTSLPRVVQVVETDDSQMADDEANTSHVFLGSAPGEGGAPVLISVPKDSNMTVKELIQMMGNQSNATDDN